MPTTRPVVVGNLLVYRGDNHITTPYADWLAPVVAQEVDGAIAEQG